MNGDAGLIPSLGSAMTAAIAAEYITFPVDTVRVRCQLSSGPCILAPVDLFQFVRQKGFRACYNGVAAGVQRQAVYATLRISMYSYIRDALVGKDKEPHLAHRIVAAASSGALGITAANPTEVVKTRLQELAGSSHKGGSTFQMYRKILKNEGLLAFWNGWGPNMARAALVCGAELSTYDTAKPVVERYLPAGPPTQCTTGLLAGTVATVVCSPADILRTRMQAAGSVSLFQAFRDVWKLGGPLGFYKGFTANVCRIGGFNMFVFLFYERVLGLLSGLRQ